MIRFIAAAAIAVLTAPAAAEVTQSSDAGFVVDLTAEAPGTPLATWKVLTAPGQWWDPEHTYSGKAENMYLDVQGSGCFCELLDLPKDAPAGLRRGSIEHMHVLYANPGATLRMKGALGPMQPEAIEGILTITLKPKEGGGTMIDWTYVVGGYSRRPLSELAPLVDRVLGVQIKRLADKLAAPAEAKPDTPPG